MTDLEVDHSRPDLEIRALRLLERWPSTATPAERLVSFYKLPGSVRGLKILDVCAGESDLTAYLSEMGAESYALDLLYDQPDYLHERVINHYIGIPQTDPRYNIAVGVLESRPQQERFYRSFRKERDKYIAGSVHKIPFPSNFFDYVLSYNGVFGVTQENFPFLQLSIEECIRVVAIGGQIQLGPMLYKSQTELGRLFQDDIIKLLGRRDDIEVVLDSQVLENSASKRLTIIKK